MIAIVRVARLLRLSERRRRTKAREAKISWDLPTLIDLARLDLISGYPKRF
jgi:hypothetical protein